LRVRMRLELQRMQRDLGITFVHVTHSQLEAIALADMVVVMDRGEIKQAGDARDVYATPRDRYVAEFLGGQNVFAGRVDAINGDRVSFAAPQMKHIAVPVGSARVSKGDTIDVAIRRDDVGLIRPGADVAADTSWLASRVLAVEYQGNFVKVMLDAAGTDEFVAYIPERTFFRDPYAIGDVVQAAWPSHLARLLAKTTALTA
jgi:putative spermidine/putrescine transport system ATP-binding protein